MTNLPTIMTSRDKLTMSLCTIVFGFWHHTIIQARIIQTSSVYYHRLNIKEFNSKSETKMESETRASSLLFIGFGNPKSTQKWSLKHAHPDESQGRPDGPSFSCPESNSGIF